MTLLQQYIESMQKGDNTALSELFEENGILHDSSVNKVGLDTIHLEGKRAVDMMFHHKFGFNGGPFELMEIQYQEPNMVTYFISYQQKYIPVTAIISSVGETGKIKRLNIFPL